MDKFVEMKVFSAVVEAGSFVGASDRLEMSKQAVSRHVAELESRLGVRLLQRTTRRLALTEEGAVYADRCKELLTLLDEAESEITTRTGEAIGQLRVNAPVTFGVLHLAKLWPAFMSRHPRVGLDITLSDRVVDLLDEGYDLAIRIARLPSSSLISRRLASTRLVLCASPDYLRARGTPRHPDDLVEHSVLTYSLLAMGDNWTFEGPDGPATVKIAPCLRSNSGDTCREAALQGAGIILQPTFLVSDDIKRGRLVELMPEYRSIELGVYAVYPSRKFVAPKVRLLIDFLAEALARHDW